jgi:hypothetical protein
MKTQETKRQLDEQIIDRKLKLLLKQNGIIDDLNSIINEDFNYYDKYKSMVMLINKLKKNSMEINKLFSDTIIEMISRRV